MKRIITALLSALLVIGLLSGCSGKEEKEKTTIVTTIFPIYDMVRNVCAGEDIEIVMLLKPGQEIHTYEPTPDDLKMVGKADIIFCIGGESDSWMEDFVDSFDDELNVCRLMDYVEPLEEEEVEGMQEEGGIFADEGEEIEYDEHIWTAPAQAITMTEVIRDEISKISGVSAEAIKANAENYLKQLKALDQDYHDFFDGKEVLMVFGDRFPFAHMAREFGMKYYAAFPGCYEGSEPSAATMAFLTDKVKEKNIKTVYYIEFSNHKVADAIAENCGCETAMIHSCHNVTQEDMDTGIGYIELMQKNLETFKNTLD